MRIKTKTATIFHKNALIYRNNAPRNGSRSKSDKRWKVEVKVKKLVLKLIKI